MASKYIGVVLEGRWRVDKRVKYGGNNAKFVLTNIYNGIQMEIYARRMSEIVQGKTTLSKLRHHRTIYNKKRGLHE